MAPYSRQVLPRLSDPPTLCSSPVLQHELSRLIHVKCAVRMLLTRHDMCYGCFPIGTGLPARIHACLFCSLYRSQILSEDPQIGDAWFWIYQQHGSHIGIIPTIRAKFLQIGVLDVLALVLGLEHAPRQGEPADRGRRHPTGDCPEHVEGVQNL